MGDQRNRVCAALAVAALGLPVLAQPTSATPRIEILGASVSAGYVDLRVGANGESNDTVPLLRVLRHIWPRDAVTMGTRSNIAMFRDPLGFGDRQLRQALRSPPDLVVAVDFMFWFGYGSVARGDRGREARLQLQAAGLQLLDRLQCPIILGDYPDMAGADARILHPRMIPDEESLAELNRRLHAWAEERARVHIFPLAAWVKQLVNEGYPLPLEKGPLQAPPLYLLQSDKLHATRLGMALLGYQVQGFIRRALPDGHSLVRDSVSLDSIIVAIGAEGELEGLKKASGHRGSGVGRGQFQLSRRLPVLAPAFGH